MTTYTAIYDTAAIRSMKYDFTAKSDDHAIKFANIKFALEVQPTLKLFQGDREIPYTYDPHEEMSISEKEAYVGARFVK